MKYVIGRLCSNQRTKLCSLMPRILSNHCREKDIKKETFLFFILFVFPVRQLELVSIENWQKYLNKKPNTSPLDVKLIATIIYIRINIALVPNKISKKIIKKQNEIIINEQIWKPKAINRPVEANSTILDLSKEQ